MFYESNEQGINLDFALFFLILKPGNLKTFSYAKIYCSENHLVIGIISWNQIKYTVLIITNLRIDVHYSNLGLCLFVIFEKQSPCVRFINTAAFVFMLIDNASQSLLIFYYNF